MKYYTPGTVSPYVQGEIDHDGSGFSLTGGGKKVELTDFVIDPGKSVLTGTVTVDGKQAAASAPLFFLDGRTLEPLKANDNGTAVLQGTTVKLKQEAADLLNHDLRHRRSRGRTGDRRREDHRQHRVEPPKGRATASGSGGTRRAPTAGGPTSG